MPTRFIRQARLRVGDITITADDLRFAFEAHHSAQEAQPSRIQVWNLSESTAAEVVESDQVSLEAGYGDSVGQILRGSIRRIDYQREGLDRVLTAEVGKVSDSARANEPMVLQDTDTTVKFIVERCAQLMGVTISDLSQLPDVSVPQWVWVGSPQACLDDILHPRGVTWTEDDGVLLFSSAEKPLRTSGGVVQVSAEEGMVGTPAVEEEGRVKVRVLLDPSISLGTEVNVQSEIITGTYRVRALIHRGDTWGETFSTDLSLSP